jgi:hypothetical protein
LVWLEIAIIAYKIYHPFLSFDDKEMLSYFNKISLKS